jgi:hypothetical protein
MKTSNSYNIAALGGVLQGFTDSGKLSDVDIRTQCSEQYQIVQEGSSQRKLYCQFNDISNYGDDKLNAKQCGSSFSVNPDDYSNPTLGTEDYSHGFSQNSNKGSIVLQGSYVDVETRGSLTQNGEKDTEDCTVKGGCTSSVWCLEDIADNVFVKEIGGESWALVMKLAGNDFCMNSGKWTDKNSYNADKLLSDEMPRKQEYDAKSPLFYQMQSVTALRFETLRGSVTVEFEEGSTPQNLMTTNNVKFSKYPDWEQWKSTFGSTRERAPMFVRNGVVVMDPPPPCRNNVFKLMVVVSHACFVW